MIKSIEVGDILDPSNEADVIIGMNVSFADVRGIGKPFVERIQRTRIVTLGSVVSFDLDGSRELHMLVCHLLGEGGWKEADKYVRYGLDYLWKTRLGRSFSIVQIGTGRIGRRDGADPVAIHSAMADSFLSVHLYIYRPELAAARASEHIIPFRHPLRMWDIEHGETPIPLVA